jgi:hypothetical protein
MILMHREHSGTIYALHEDDDAACIQHHREAVTRVLRHQYLAPEKVALLQPARTSPREAFLRGF